MLEVNLQGVYVPAPLIWAGVAFVLCSFLDWMLSRTRVYRLVWHRGLFDAAVFLILWGAISAVAYHVAFSEALAR
jgi:hypothetical protein